MHEREAARLLGQLRGVGVGADLGDLCPRRPGDDEAARQQLVADRLDDRVGLAGEERLVDLEVRAGEHRRVGHDLLPGPQIHHVVEHELVHRQLVDLAVAHGHHLRGVHDRQPVEGALRPQLLDDADQRVGDDHPAEQRVPIRPADHHDRPQRPDQGVELREQVGAKDLGEGPRRRIGDIVDLATSDTIGDVRRSETALCEVAGIGNLRPLTVAKVLVHPTDGSAATPGATGVTQYSHAGGGFLYQRVHSLLYRTMSSTPESEESQHGRHGHGPSDRTVR